MIEPSPYQLAIFHSLGTENCDLAVIARAGSGKTTTIIEGTDYIPGGGRTLLCAFNNEIKAELERRVTQKRVRGTKVLSLHGLGLATIRRHPDFSRAEIDDKKGANIAKAVLEKTDYREDADARLRLEKAASLVKSTLTSSREDLLELIQHHALDREDLPAELLADYVKKACVAAIDDKIAIDFDDMIWLPNIHRIQPPTYTHVIVDECQDMCLAQLRLAQAARRDGGRIVVVGDPKQAIYGWRGADEDGVARMIAELNAKVLPLSVSYRCPRKVVELARKYVPDIEPAPNAPDGHVAYIDLEEIVEHVRPGDYVLSRSNAPLARVCLMLLSNDIPARVIGRDLTQTLMSLVKRSRARNISDLFEWLDGLIERETARLEGRESALKTVLDTIQTVKNLCADAPDDDVSFVLTRINKLFIEDKADQSRFVACSTVHKAKGKERHRVFLLEETFHYWPGPEEDNVHYVAITRSKHDLFVVDGLYKKRV